MRLIITSCILLLSLCSNAQQVLFEEDFEGFPSYQIAGWGHQHSGPIPWTTGLPYLVGGLCHNWPGPNKIAGIPETCAGINHNNSNVLLITPPIDLSTNTDIWLSYDSYFLNYTDSTYTEWATVEVTTDAGNTWDTIRSVPANNAWMLQRSYIDLSAYQGLTDVRIGFRYSDGGGLMKGWEIDNVLVFEPSHKDLLLQYVTPTDSMLSYVEINKQFIHHGQVFNYGLDTITEFTAKYRMDNGTVYEHTFTGLQIPPFTTHNFIHPVLDTVPSAGRHKVTMWVETAGDNIHYNDTAYTWLNGVYFKPDKLLVIEEGTGTWNVWGPRGWVLMNQAAGNDLNICQISVHSNPDSMAMDAYADYLFYLDYYYEPFFLFDRRKNVEPDSFFYEINKMKNYFGFANIDMSGGLWGTSLSINANITPALDMQGDYRLALVITEDSVRGTSSGYDQRNKYAGGLYGPMGGFETKPDPVPAADMYYNFVARKTFPSPEGVQGMLLPNLDANQTYSYTFHTDIDPSWNINRLKAYVLLIDHGDSTILNAQRLGWSLGVADAGKKVSEIGMYPNPSSIMANVYFSTTTTERLAWTLCDISGRIIKQNTPQQYPAGKHEISLQTADLQPGVYLFTLQGDDYKKTVKVQVMR